MNIAIVDTNKERLALCKAVIDGLAGASLAWVAMDEKQAVEKAAINTPNLILLDVALSGAVEPVMKQSPTAILVMTSDVSAASDRIFRVMGQGALDVIRVDMKQEGEAYEAIQNKVLLAIMLINAKKEPLKSQKHFTKKAIDDSYPPLVVLGASTGGPAALSKLFSNLPADATLAFVVVQHVDEIFTGGLADWLQKKTSLKVEVARRGARPKRGAVLIAASSDHLVMNANHQLHYTPFPIERPYRPSVDVFFESVADHWPDPAAAILLTGMGSDGAIGLKRLSDAGWYTAVQDESSCAVYGMPKAALEIADAHQVLTLEEMETLFLNMMEPKC